MKSARQNFSGFVFGVIGAVCLTAGAAPPPAYGASPDPNPPVPTARSAQQDECLGRGAIRAYSDRTGLVNFVGTPAGERGLTVAGVADGVRPEQAARTYLSNCGAHFGLRDQGQELTLKRESQAEKGSSVVKFQQSHRGVPVIGAELNVQLDANRGVQMVNGEILPDVAVDTNPRVTAAAARAAARTAVANEYQLLGAQRAGLTVTGADLWIYEPELIGFQGPTALVWRMTVTRSDPPALRQLVLVDARDGTVLLSLNQIDTARNRTTYDMNNGTSYPGTLRCAESNPDCNGGDRDEVNAHLYSGDTYNFYLSNHNRDSINNAGMALNSHVHYSTGYCNAFWDGSRMTYGDGCSIVVDDVVAHEMTHGVTQYESGLIYANQSGAINEAFSDIWGEWIDLSNNRGTDTAAVRWLMGEDASIGAIRDMKNPPAFSDPDRMGSPYYYVGSGDNGGVHSNSGVGNKAAYLITDGDTFNGYTITGIGITKAAKIFYKVQADILTSGATYAMLGSALSSACDLLVGTSSITAADCTQVRNATYATEMVSPGGLTAPSNLAATAVSSTQTDLAWTDNSSNETGFRIERKTGATGTWAQIATTGANVVSYSNSGLTDGTVYYYRVQAYNSVGTSGYSNEATTACSLPIGVGTTVSGALTTADCRSTLRSGAYYDGYTFSATAGATYTITLNSTAFDAYLYLLNGSSVVAQNDDSNGGLNSSIVYTAPAAGILTIQATSYAANATGAYTVALAGPTTPIPAAPSNATAAVVSASQINLGWQDNSTNESGFRIERKTGATGTWAEIATSASNTTSYSNTGLSAGTYYYRVRAYNSGGNSGYSNEISATIPVTCSSSTTPITPNSSLSGTLAVTDCRSSVRGSTYYYDNFSLAVTAGSIYTITLNATAFDTYLYLLNGSVVLAQDDDSNGSNNARIVYTATAAGTLTIHATSWASSAIGAYTVSVALGTLPSAPTNLTGAAGSATQVNLSWADTSSNETGFRVERKLGASGVWGQIGTTAANTSSYSNTGLTANTTYYYRVMAYNAAGNSGYSNEFSVTTPAACSSSTTAMVSGGTASGTLSVTDCRATVRPNSFFDSFTFTATAGTTYTIGMNSTAFDAYLYLFDSAGSQVAANDDSDGSTNARISYTATTSGTFTIQATSFGSSSTGAYTVSLAASCGSTPIGAGTPVNGTLATTDCRSTQRTGSYSDSYTFAATAGSTYRVTLTSTAFDAYLYLLNSAGAVVAYNDDSNGSLNALISYTATTSETLTIQATSYSSGSTGAYVLTRN